DPESNLRTLSVAALNGKMVWPALGFHPELTRLSDEDLAIVEAQVGQHHARLVALGEAGLPWYRLDGPVPPAAPRARRDQRLARQVGGVGGGVVGGGEGEGGHGPARLVALGEVGLPWYCLDGAVDRAALVARGEQRFARLLDLAGRFDLPVVVHAPHGAAARA